MSQSDATLSIEVTFTQVEVVTKRSYKGMTGGWSKWGGARKALWQEAIKGDWICQSCGRTQPELITPYRYEFAPEDYLRVCAVCLADGCSPLKKRLAHDPNFWEL